MIFFQALRDELESKNIFKNFYKYLDEKNIEQALPRRIPIEQFGENFAELYHEGKQAIRKLLDFKRG